ncbi:MAG: hypothetical protein WCS17_04810 [Prevotella sp.]
MMAKTQCQFCGKYHNVRFAIDPDNFLEECNDDQDYVISIFKCLVFPDVFEQKDENHTIRDAKQALEELEKDFLNKIGEFEEAYGVTVSGMETNISNKPAWDRAKEKHTNSLILYSDLS